MGLRMKFNLVLLAVFAIGLGVTGYVSYDLLHKGTSINSPEVLSSLSHPKTL